MVAAIGNTFKDSVETVADKQPKTKFVLVDEQADKKYKNVVSVKFHSEQSSYLVGVAAAKKAQEVGDKTVGFIGGMRNSVIESFLAGYQAGVKSVDPSIKVDATYAGTFSDPAKGQTIAKAKIAQGEHVIFQAAGGVGNGVFQAEKIKVQLWFLVQKKKFGSLVLILIKQTWVTTKPKTENKTI